jgi:tight adherence protein B
MSGWLSIAAGMTAVLLAFVAGSIATAQARAHERRLSRLSSDTLADLFWFVDTKRLVAWTSGGFVAVCGVGVALGASLPVALFAGLLTWFVPTAAVRILAARRLQQLTAQLPDMLDSLSMSLRAGLSVTQSLGQLAAQQPRPIAHELDLLVRKQRVGVSLDTALVELTQRIPTPEYSMFATTVRISRETGGGLAEALDRLAATLRRKLALDEKIRALTAQGRIQGIVVALLPPLVLLWLSPEAMRPLFHSPIGWVTLAGVVLLEVAGLMVIRKIVRIEV